MNVLPRLTPTCGRCGKPREKLIGHVCRSNSRRKATVKLKTSWGQCPKCHKPTTFLGIGHTCQSKKGDFGRRRKAFAKQQRSAKRANRTQHLYQSCDDQGCRRTACVAYKEGLKLGAIEGFDRGYEIGFVAGQNACPQPHGRA